MGDIEEVLNNNYIPVEAIVVYERENVDYNYYPNYKHLVTRHRIVRGMIAEGRPITRSVLKNLVKMVLPNIKDEPCIIPPEVLFYAPMDNFVAWWVPSGERNLFFHKNTGIKTGRYPVPPSLFAVKNRRLHVWALRENHRPSEETRLYHTPFFNVFENGTCMGDMALPRENGIRGIEKWNRLFFESAFTAASTPVLKGISGKQLWRSIRGMKGKFPSKHLAPYKVNRRALKLKDLPEIL